MDIANVSLDIEQHVDVDRPIADVFAGIITEFAEKMRYPDGRSMNFKLEARPGGRWFRDLGNSTGHLWGFVQVIKPPTMLEISGPLFMSYPTVNHLEIRLAETAGTTRVTLRHRAIGPIEDQHRTGMAEGWKQMLDEIKKDSEA